MERNVQSSGKISFCNIRFSYKVPALLISSLFFFFGGEGKEMNGNFESH